MVTAYALYVDVMDRLRLQNAGVFLKIGVHFFPQWVLARELTGYIKKSIATQH